jgi:hypothetical protein
VDSWHGTAADDESPVLPNPRKKSKRSKTPKTPKTPAAEPMELVNVDVKPDISALNETPYEIWPLIKLVKIRCNAQALSTGAILVDLPGVADANAARGQIAKDYMKTANFVWVVAPIAR